MDCAREGEVEGWTEDGGGGALCAAEMGWGWVLTG